MDMFQCIPARCNEPSFHGYCSNYSSISSSDTNSISINNEELMSLWAMYNYDSSASFGSFLPQEEEEEEEDDRLVTATQSDTNPLSSTSKEEQDEDNEVLEEAEDRREKDEQEDHEVVVVEEEEDRREKGEKRERKEAEEGKKRKRKRVKISKDPQSIAARNRRHRISQKMRVLRKLVPGGMKMDTASMLDEAIQHLKRLKDQVRSMAALMNALENAEPIPFPFPFPMPIPMEYYY